MSRHDGSRSEDRLERLMSASLDGEIGPEDRAWLDERLARDPDARERMEAFVRVDTELRRLADASVSEERLAAIRTDLDSRLEAESAGSLVDGGTRTPSGMVPVPGAGRFRRQHWVPAVVAAAAAILLYLLLPGSGGDSEGPAPSLEMVGIPVPDPAPEAMDSDPGAAVDGELDPDLEEGLSVVLGYGEDPHPGDDSAIDDLEVIEQLDLLDFLSSREMAGRG